MYFDIQHVYNPKNSESRKGGRWNAVSKPYNKSVEGYKAMRINFYETMLSEDNRTMLVKEKGVNYGIGKISNPKETVRMMNELLHMDKLAEEYCYMIALNSSCRIMGVFFISKGTVNASLISAREVYMRALLIGAVMVVLCHNHPSGNAQPSSKDIKITAKIKQAGELLDIHLADHIIIGKGDYYSFEENGLL